MSTIESDVDIGPEDGPAGDATPFGRRAPRISQADVFAAADALLVAGHRPTIDRVRMRLGRGSPNTINDHLDAWWAKLGSRLRDLPGHEFPQLPERVAQTLQHLWNEALEEAHQALHDTLAERERTSAQRELALQMRERELGEREHAATARATALEQSLSFAREQLTAANQRAERLESALQQRDTEVGRLQTRIEDLEHTLADFRTKLETAETEHQAERTRLEERHAAAEGRWLREVDGARQSVKDAAKEHERQFKALRNQLDLHQSERENLRQQLGDARSELKAAHAVRAHLEERLRRLQDVAPHPKSPAAATKRARRPAKKARPG